MIHDSNLIALRAGLPWLFLGLLCLATSLALWLFDVDGARRTITTASAALGALGSGLFLLGLLQLARGRIARRFSGWLVLAFAAWLGEFALRMNDLVRPEVQLVAQRWLCAALACAALSVGMPRLWDRRPPEGQVRLWRRSARLFTVQLLAAASLWIAADVHDTTTLEAWRDLVAPLPLALGHALAWLVFTVPFAHLLLAFRHTARCVDRRAGVTEILHG